MNSNGKYWILVDGKQKGPYVIANLMEMHLTSDVKVWREGESEWKNITSFPELSPFLSSGDKNNNKTKLFILSLLSGILTIVVVVLVFNLSSLKKRERIINTELSEKELYAAEIQSTLQVRESELQEKLSKIKSEYADISSVYPFKITDIHIGNVQSGGSEIDSHKSIQYATTDIYSYNIRYLQPKIYFTGYIDKSIEIRYKLYNPNGTLNYNSSYSTAYTGSPSEVYIKANKDDSATLKGWGNAEHSTFSSGRYRIEIWHDDICFKSMHFDIK